MTADDDVTTVLEDLTGSHPAIFAAASRHSPAPSPEEDLAGTLAGLLRRRLNTVQTLVECMVDAQEREIDAVITQLSRWMNQGAIVRVLGAGRARLAAAIPANRLAHGGARVYLQDDVIPMPHSLYGGGIIAASASGKTPSVLSALRQARQKNKDIAVVGIASADARDFAGLCSIFMGIPRIDDERAGQLRALADIEEHVISELLDALVVAAGLRLGYTDASWRLGHEDLGFATGPYDYKPTS